ncbi:GCN5-related N-acetyltransferase 6, chloroplastic isoform X2 [Amaranthus tricolor]|uniref:GCN5-related N-acetyltransferase 6, chloroplastic isoform X2 n=1 Tax=Amaranthus tricolor TaxID=29722 RepID=UPI00258F6164|nr:GCN5-related N-acetyltransferase 6, chloroplastic isoform X2 [Amaranthus tricolor]
MFSKLAFTHQPICFKYFSNTKTCPARPSGFLCKMEIKSRTPLIEVEEEDLRKEGEANCIDGVPKTHTLKRAELEFTKLQQLGLEINHDTTCYYFGDFVARQPFVDEEYWTAAWLRAESHWEDLPNQRYADSYKRQFAEKEYNALKRRCKGNHEQQSTCIITVKKEVKNVKHTILKSVVGTLDLNVRYLLQGESFPGERVEAPLFCSIDRKGTSKYGYIANLCVAKSARRKGIAINMLKYAIESAKSKGAEMVFVHVYRKNIPAQKLYEKLGFKVVEVASLQLVEEGMYLLCCKT